MKFSVAIPLFLLAHTIEGQEPSIAAAAAKYFPNVSWQADTVVSADFTCRGRKETAILGTDTTYITIAVFINGLKKAPKILQYLARVRDRANAHLEIESLDYDPEEDPGYALTGFQRSKVCKGFKLDDGRTDSAHIYWNHLSRQFDDWSR